MRLWIRVRHTDEGTLDFFPFQAKGSETVKDIKTRLKQKRAIYTDSTDLLLLDHESMLLIGKEDIDDDATLQDIGYKSNYVIDFLFEGSLFTPHS